MVRYASCFSIRRKAFQEEMQALDRRRTTDGLVTTEMGEETTAWRKTDQYLVPSATNPSEKGEYDIYPSFPLGPKKVFEGYASLAKWIMSEKKVIIDGYIGVFWKYLRNLLDQEFKKAGVKVVWFEMATMYHNSEEIAKLIKPFMGDEDPLFGSRCTKDLIDFFNSKKVDAIEPDKHADVNILIGCGAGLVDWEAPLLYIDMPKNEIQFRSRAGSICNLGASKPDEPKRMYKRFYFIDWVVLNKHKKSLLPKADVIIDGQRPNEPTWISGDDLRSGLHKMSRNFLRVRPWFEPGPWGGNWIKNKINGLNKAVKNYAWSFELIVPENGLIFESDNRLIEVSFDLLMYQEPENVLGNALKRFGNEFPIRFDFLDTMEGGNLSVQCHPRPGYISRKFGENFTQDEAYYILDAGEDAEVFLGFKEEIKPEEFKQTLEESSSNGTPVDIQKFVQIHPSHKHDLFLIPNGTIHASAKNNLVLEISTTPYIFTFKMYDWLRLDLDGKPRPLNINRAFSNLHFNRKGESVKKELISTPVLEQKGEDWKRYHLPTHDEHFYDVNRYEFDSEIFISLENKCNVLMLVEGSSVILETADGMKQRFNYAETFVIPAACHFCKLINEWNSSAMVIQVFIKDEKPAKTMQK